MNDSIEKTNLICRRGCSFLIAALLLIASATINAYTIIKRDGRRLEVSNDFVLTPTTLTYEAAPGIKASIKVADIDIARTERANNETPGSFSVKIKSTQQTHKGGAGEKTRTLTNRDLETAKTEREKSERAALARRSELNIPSAAEMRRNEERDDKVLRDLIEQNTIKRRQAESYWRARAVALRTEIAALDAEINFLRTRIVEVSTPVGGSYVTTAGFNALATPFLFSSVNSLATSPTINITPGASASPNFPIGGNNALVSPTLNNLAVGSNAAARGRLAVGGGVITRGVTFAPQILYAPAYGYAGAYNYYDYQREALVERLNVLETARAGLAARWRALEDEARQAGASPGWLR